VSASTLHERLHSGAARLPAAIPPLVLAVASFALYANTLGNGFVDDDTLQVLNNPWIRDVRHLPEVFSHGVWSFMGESEVSNYYRPLMHVFYMAEYHFFGLRAWGFHLVNVLLHAVSTVIVYLLAVRLFGAPRSSSPPIVSATPLSGVLLGGPFAAGLLFAVHPIHTEAVAWIASLPELSFSFFCLIALQLYARTERPFTAPHILSAAAFFTGLLCKETALALLLVLPAWSLACGVGRFSQVDRLRIGAPFAFAALLYLAARYLALSRLFVPVGETRGLSSWQLILNAPTLLGAYLGEFLLPAGLSFWHTFEPVTSLASARSIAGLAVAAGLACLLWLAFKRDRFLYFSLVLGLVPLLPALYIAGIPNKPFAERYLYLPSAGLILTALWIPFGRNGVRRALVWLVLAPVMAACATATVQRNGIWRDDMTLYADTVRKSPDAAMPRYLLARALYEGGRTGEAIDQYKILVASHPRVARYEAALGTTLIVAGRLDEAIEHLNAALVVDPGARDVYNDLGTALYRSGRPTDAIEAYGKALAIDPAYAEAHYNLAAVLATEGRPAEALDHFMQAARLQPENAQYRNALGISYAELGRRREAIEQFEAAIRLDPNLPAYRSNLEKATRGRAE
jgi:tetratricopeptide (TPR) repeat protein